MDLSNEAENFDHMSHNLVGWDGLDELDSVVSLEISHRASVFNLSNDSKVRYIEDKLDVDIDLVGDFPQCVFDEKDVASLERGFQINTSSVLDEESDFGFVVGGFQVNMTCDLLKSANLSLVHVFILKSVTELCLGQGDYLRTV